LLGVGDGLGTVIVGILVALFRSWNSGYLRQYLDCRGGETEGEQDRFEDLVERVDSMERACHRKILTKGSRVWKVCPAQPQPCRV